ncbi:MAG: hypothetical protein HC852_03625 [Acaryochloridaceae cyanobacterium RU_4_10]|nr:hypothetical protein [Acaryochloridaceae cyanobacterium RU_4_10]
MGRLSQIWKSSLVGCGAISAVVCSATVLRAQAAPYPSGDLNGTQELNDIWNGNSGQGTSSLYSLINKLQLSGGRSASDFSAEQDEGFQSALSDFRKKQQEKLQTSPATPTQPVLTVPVSPSKP